MKTLSVPAILTLVTAVASHAQTELTQEQINAAANGPYQIAARGQDFAVYRKVTCSEDSTGWGEIKTNQFTCRRFASIV